MKILIVAAWAPELVRAREHAALWARAEIAFEAIGVGLVEAAIGATRALLEHRPTLAFLIGTCGAFTLEAGRAATAMDAIRIGDAVVAARVRLVDGAALDANAELPGPMPYEADLTGDVHDRAVEAGAKSVHIANTLGITVDDAYASRVAQRAAAHVEHLEAFAFVRASHAVGVPCAVVLAVANEVGTRGRGQWASNHVAASARAADVVFDALPSILRTTTRAPQPGRA